MSRIRRGFTLVELIITLVIIGILAGIAWISYSALQARAKFGALKTTALSVDHEATALAAADNAALDSTYAVTSISTAANDATSPYAMGDITVTAVTTADGASFTFDNGQALLCYTPGLDGAGAALTVPGATTNDAWFVDGACVAA